MADCKDCKNNKKKLTPCQRCLKEYSKSGKKCYKITKIKINFLKGEK